MDALCTALGVPTSACKPPASPIAGARIHNTGQLALDWAIACQGIVDAVVADRAAKANLPASDVAAWFQSWMLNSGALGPGTVRVHGINASYVPPGMGIPYGHDGRFDWWTIAVAWDATKVSTTTDAHIADAIATLHRQGRLAWFLHAVDAWDASHSQKQQVTSPEIRASAALPATRTATSQPKASPAPVQAKAGVPRWAWLLAAAAIAVGVGAAVADRD